MGTPAPVKTGPQRRRYNWQAVRTVYVEGIPAEDGTGIRWPSIAEAARTCQVPVREVQRRAKREGWSNDRAAYQARLADARTETRLEDLTEILREADSRALGSARAGLALVHSRMTALTRQAAENATGPGGRAGAFDADGLELTRLAKAAEAWQSVLRRSLGEPEPESGTVELGDQAAAIMASITAEAEAYVAGVVDGRAAATEAAVT